VSSKKSAPAHPSRPFRAGFDPREVTSERIRHRLSWHSAADWAAPAGLSL